MINSVVLLFLLTDIGMPLEAWVSLVVAGVGVVLWFLVRDIYKRMNDSITENMKEVAENKKEFDLLKEEFNKEKVKLEFRFGEMKINILEGLDNIKKDFNEFRK